MHTAERVTDEFLAAYYGGGVHSRGTMGLGPAEAVISALRRYEAAGVSEEASVRAEIPLRPDGPESLNVAMART